MHVPDANGGVVFGEEIRGVGESFKPARYGRVRGAHSALEIGATMSEIRITLFVTLVVVAWLVGLWLLAAPFHG